MCKGDSFSPLDSRLLKSPRSHANPSLHLPHPLASTPSHSSSESPVNIESCFYVNHSVVNVHPFGRSAHLLYGLNVPCPLGPWALESCVDGIRKPSPERGLLYKRPHWLPGKVLYNRNLGGLLNRTWGLEYTGLMTFEKSKHQSQGRVKAKWPSSCFRPENNPNAGVSR